MSKGTSVLGCDSNSLQKPTAFILVKETKHAAVVLGRGEHNTECAACVLGVVEKLILLVCDMLVR